MKKSFFYLFIAFIFSTNLVDAQFNNPGPVSLCINGSYYLNPSRTDGTFSTNDPLIATVNASGYVTGVSAGSTIVSLVISGVGTVSATINVVASLSPSLTITDPTALSNYKFDNNPHGPIGGTINYIGYKDFNYSSQTRPSNTGYYRASRQDGNETGCPIPFYIIKCDACSGTVSQYASRPQGTLTGSTIGIGGTGQLTYTSSNGGGPFTIIYQAIGASPVTANNISSTVAFNLATGTPTRTTTYNLINVTDQSTSSSADFTGVTATITIDQNMVTIGSQNWTNKNLDVTTYQNGDPIPEVTDPTAWAGLITGAWCYYNNDNSNNATYGKLYNWHAVNDPRGLAPAGWHIPTYEEWTTLGSSLGGNSIAGGKMKATGTNTLRTGLWDSPNSDATNISGFSGLPGGFRNADGTFNYVGQLGYWWSFTQPSPDIYGGGFYRRLQSNDPTVESLDNPKKSGMSVRLIKGDHYLGESFGGGKVAYILVSGDLGYDANVQHGLIASTSNISAGIQWYNGNNTTTGATATAIGTGLDNTTSIITSQLNTGSYAAKLCADYFLTVDGVTYTDWYLPSKEELNQLYKNRAVVGGFAINYYWSSTEDAFDIAWLQNFGNGSQFNYAKLNTYYVRAIRSF